MHQKLWQDNKLNQLHKFNFKSQEWRNFNTNVFDEAIMDKKVLKIWVHVYGKDSSFGFSYVKGIIIDHPDRNWEGQTLRKYYDEVLEPNNTEYVKVAEIQLN